jgi:hypothetical protein
MCSNKYIYIYISTHSGGSHAPYIRRCIASLKQFQCVVLNFRGYSQPITVWQISHRSHFRFRSFFIKWYNMWCGFDSFCISLQNIITSRAQMIWNLPFNIWFKVILQIDLLWLVSYYIYIYTHTHTLNTLNTLNTHTKHTLNILNTY